MVNFTYKHLVLIGMILISKILTAQVSLDSLMDKWHSDAAKCRFEEYFSFMDDSFVFLGTAPEERWDKAAFSLFSKPYFDIRKAWDFKPSNRKWAFYKDLNVAWFDEELDTWMRGCRGSGVLIKVDGHWKLAQYNLTVLIENEKMKEFILLRDLKK
jgi:hypothetical protein